MYENRKIGIRLVAYIVDILIVAGLSTIITGFGVGETQVIFDVTITQLTYWQSFLLYLIYFVGFSIFNEGITVGKMVTGVTIVSIDGETLTQNKLILRETIKSVFMPISFISFFVALIREDKRAIHDLFVDSCVIKESKEVADPYNLRGTQDYESKPRYQDPLDRESNQSVRRERQFNTPDDYYDDPADKMEDVDPLDETDDYYK